jgi:plasmid stabilization system protein ParE
MTIPVRILRKAQADLLGIQSYIGRERPSAARRIVDRLLQAIDTLSENPEKGPLARDEWLRRGRFRFLVNGRYLIFYKTGRGGVRVYRVIHGKRDYRRLL